MIEHLGIRLSMTEKGDPYENAIAERVNGILKTELGLNKVFATYNEAMLATANAVEKYNNRRPHLSCDRLTPLMAHEQKGILKKHWKNKVYKPSVVDDEAGGQVTQVIHSDKKFT